MRIITLQIFLLFTSLAFSQHYINMSNELKNINGHLAIDGNQLQAKYNTSEQIIITGSDMVLNHRSSFKFHNIIVQLSGKIIVKGDIRPALSDSYIFCRDAGALKSKNIIEVKNFAKVQVSNVSYIKSLKGNPEICIYNGLGKRIFKGRKSETQNLVLPISRYDVKVIGLEFKDKLLFCSN